MGDDMIPMIDKKKTGERIGVIMRLRGVSVQDVKSYLSLGSVQSVYHWLEGLSLPTLDNLYILSELLQVPMDMLISGTRCLSQRNDQARRLRLQYYLHLMQKNMAS